MRFRGPVDPCGPMIVVLVGAPIVGAILGILLARGMFRKHFEKAGIL